MMLVHKPPQFSLSPPPSSPVFHHHHRRHPSAPPAVVVQPTRTPGLLSLSKPQRSPRPTPAQRKTPSVPKPRPTPAEDTDPFLVKRHPSPTKPLSIPPATPKPPKALSIPPATPAPAPKALSRSVPLPRHRPAKRTATLLPPFEFPICDDLTDAGDLSDAGPPTPTRRRHREPAPAPKSKPTQRHTKPPPPKQPQFTPKHTRPARNHRRAPSDSLMVFHMSSDESGTESTPAPASSSRTTLTSDDEALRTLLKNLAVQRKDMKTPPPHAQRDREAAFEHQALAAQQAHTQGQGQGYFASSMFQNSPSPEELPDPMF